MNIKFAEQSRVAGYGIALGTLLYAVWRGLVRDFRAGIFIHDGRAAGVGPCESTGPSATALRNTSFRKRGGQ